MVRLVHVVVRLVHVVIDGLFFRIMFLIDGLLIDGLLIDG
jgi:hypothetical protein